MLELPNNFKTRIMNRYGPEGKEWLDTIDDLVEKYKNKFQLQNIQLVDNLSMNIVLFAKSSQYGNVVMKLGAPGPISNAEINVMKYYSSDYVPKCYYSCIKDRFLLLERLSPGCSLSTLSNIEERIKIFSDISNHLLIPYNNKEIFPTFEEYFRERIEYVHEHVNSFSEIIWMIDIANHLYAKLRNMNLPNYILHDDLHHKNILKTENSWKAIDPHGLIGEKVLETSQFIRLELELDGLSNQKIEKIVSLLSKYYNEDEKLILESLYINTILKVIWYTKNKYSSQTISYNIDICQVILPYISK